MGESRHPWRARIIVVSCVVAIVDCAGRLVVDAFYGSDRGVIDVIQAMLVLQVFLTEYSKIENLLSCAPSCFEACLFFFDDLLSLWFQSIQEDS